VDSNLTSETVSVDSDLFSAEFTNRGGRLLSWELFDYDIPDGAPVQMVGRSAEIGLLLETDQGLVDLDQPLYAVRREPGSDGARRIVFRTRTTDGIQIIKTYTVPADGYLLGLDVEISGAVNATNYRLTWDGGVPPAEGDNKQFRSGAGSLILVGKALEVLKSGKFKTEREREIEGAVRWAGVRNKYFLAAIVPPAGASSRVVATGNDLDGGHWERPGEDHRSPGGNAAPEWRGEPRL
jgi:YidC/Oxa1 family membrane protein insertase